MGISSEVQSLIKECPGHEDLAAYADGLMASTEQAVMEFHLAECRACRATIALAIETERVNDPARR